MVGAKLFRQLSNKNYRDRFGRKHASASLAYQIRVMRESRGWTQEQLAERLLESHDTIIQMEHPDYDNPDLETLLKMAKLFDVALVVRFVTFQELIEWTETLSPAALNTRPFDPEHN